MRVCINLLFWANLFVLLPACSSSKKNDSSTETPTASDELDSSLLAIAKSTKSLATKTASHSDPLYFAPFPFSELLEFNYVPGARTVSNSLSNRQRYMLKSVAGNYLHFASSNTPIASSTFSSYSDTLAKIFQVVADSHQATWFRIDSELHGLYSLDTDASGNLSFVNNRGNAASPSSRGYVVFAYDTGSKLLQAKARYAYDLSTFTHSASADSSFPAANYYVKETAGTFALTASAGDATAFTLENSPIDVEMPKDFNPDSISYQSNASIPIKDYIGNKISDMEGVQGKVQQGLDSNYLAQVASIGDQAGTETAAIAMLQAIEDSLLLEGASLRYPKELYLAFRKAALRTILKSDGIANGTLDMHTVPYVYFTNAADTSGAHHPFMVVASYSIADKPNRLLDVRRPPGDGTTGGYADQKVTRDATLQLNLVKIPLRNYGNIANLTDNTLLASLNSDAGSKEAVDVLNYASTSGIGVAVDGVIIYPVLNNTLTTAHAAAEITSNGIHVGQGMGLHYHGDGHSANSNDLSLYNILDYEGQSHPPLIGFGLDGIALFGIYEELYPDMEAFDSGLDSYGGHTHGALGYHYHAHTYQATTSKGGSYTAHALMRGAWKGNINSIPEFWDTNKKEPAYSLAQKTKYVGKK